MCEVDPILLDKRTRMLGSKVHEAKIHMPKWVCGLTSNIILGTCVVIIESLDPSEQNPA